MGIVTPIMIKSQNHLINLFIEILKSSDILGVKFDYKDDLIDQIGKELKRTKEDMRIDLENFFDESFWKLILNISLLSINDS